MERELLMIQRIQMAWHLHVWLLTGFLVLTVIATADKSGTIKSVMYRAILSAEILPNTSKLIGQCVSVQMAMS